MKAFSQLGIAPVRQGLQGDKIKIERVMNREIIVHRFEIKPSKFTDKGNGSCLHIEIEVSGNKHVVFTGSGILMDMIKKVDQENFPFTTKIIKDESDRFIFT